MPISVPPFAIPSSEIRFRGADARGHLRSHRVSVVAVAPSKMRHGAAAVRLLDGVPVEVRISKEHPIESELGQWMLYHELAHILDETRVVLQGRGGLDQIRSSKYARTFEKLLDECDRDEIARFTPFDALYRLKLADGSEVSLRSVEEAQSNTQISERQRVNAVMALTRIAFQVRSYRRTPSELFAEALACWVIRREFFIARFQKAAAFLSANFPHL